MGHRKVITLSRKTKFCCSANPISPQSGSGSSFGEGKNYFFSIFLCGDIDPISGLTVNITELKPIIGDILSLVDHKNLPFTKPKEFSYGDSPGKILEYLVANIQPKLERLPVQLTKAVLEWKNGDETESLMVEI